MNIKIKILLPVMIVSLSALVIPLEGHSENSKTESVAVQTAVRTTEYLVENFIEEQPVAINFEFDRISSYTYYFSVSDMIILKI